MPREPVREQFCGLGPIPWNGRAHGSGLAALVVATAASARGGTVAAAAVRRGRSLAAAALTGLTALAWLMLELLGAAYISTRYFTGPTCWLLYGWALWRLPTLRLVLVMYQLWIISPRGRRAIGTNTWPWLLRSNPLCWGLLTYFQGSQLVKTAALDPSHRYIFAGHPHGLLGNAWFLAWCTDLLGFQRLFPGIRLSVGVLDLNLRIPFCREICLLLGLCDVDRGTLLRRLAAGPGAAVFLAVGGARESLLTQRGCMDLVLQRRRGFVRLALQAGADLVPVIAFGENEMYHRAHPPPGSLPDRLQWATKKICGFALPQGYGRGVLNLQRGPLPERLPVTVVVGPPLRLPCFSGDLNSEEGGALVEEWHARYCEALLALYSEHKDCYAPNRKRDMQLVE